MHANQRGRNDGNHKNEPRNHEGKENPSVSCRQPSHSPCRTKGPAYRPAGHGCGGGGQQRQGSLPENPEPQAGCGRVEALPSGIEWVAGGRTSQSSLPGGQGVVSDIPGGRNLCAHRAECSSARLRPQAISCGGTVPGHPKNRQRRSPL